VCCRADRALQRRPTSCISATGPWRELAVSALEAAFPVRPALLSARDTPGWFSATQPRAQRVPTATLLLALRLTPGTAGYGGSLWEAPSGGTPRTCGVSASRTNACAAVTDGSTTSNVTTTLPGATPVTRMDAVGTPAAAARPALRCPSSRTCTRHPPALARIITRSVHHPIARASRRSSPAAARDVTRAARVL
jgi:hypothetical protein